MHTPALQRARRAYRPQLPGLLRDGLARVAWEEGAAPVAGRDAAAIRSRFPQTFDSRSLRLIGGNGPEVRRALRVGVVLSGGQAPGGHNVITGVFDALCGLHPGSQLFGFLGGPRGIWTRRNRELSADVIYAYRNTGGFDMIGAGRDKIETAEQLADSKATCEALSLDGLLIIGGDDSNTNAATLAEYFVAQRSATVVIGVPKTIDGDMKGGGVETSFGFDTATKVYSDLIGNICRDAKSAGKYWHFIKLMGRSASHVALECALQTHPNVTLIGEEVRELRMTLEQVVEQIAEVVRRRAEGGLHHGVCLVPEGLIEFIPEVGALIAELNRILQSHAEELAEVESLSERLRHVEDVLDPHSRGVFERLPERIQQQLLLERASHGNVQVSKIDTEALLVELVAERLARAAAAGEYRGKLQVQHHFFGYEGRCAAPSDFDADYAYSLGCVAAALIAFDKTGYICAVQNLAAPTEQWRGAGVPLTSLMQLETRKGRPTPVIGKALVRLDGEPFGSFAAQRERWQLEDDYVFPGAIQYFGPPEVSGLPTLTTLLEQGRPDPRTAEESA
jgi:pyrophosphate--fructose-6-phosphate 1-phosphotransferase